MFGNGFPMGTDWFFGILIMVGVVLLVVLLVRILAGGVKRDAGGTTGEQRVSSARQLLDERYARGELDAEQYRERVRVLGEDR